VKYFETVFFVGGERGRGAAHDSRDATTSGRAEILERSIYLAEQMVVREGKDEGFRSLSRAWQKTEW